MNNGRFRILRNALLLAMATGMGVAGSALASDTAASLRTTEIRLRNAVEKQPANGMLRVELAKVYLELGNGNAAVAELFVAHQLKAKDELVAPLMAQAQMETGDFGDLLRDVPEGTRPPKVESLVRTYRGMAEIALGETHNAEVSLADAERLDPKNVLAKIASVRMLLGQQQLGAASQKIDQVLAIAPNNSAALELKGLVEESRGDEAGALRFFDSAISHNRLNVQAILDRANLEANRNQLDLAAKDIAAARAMAPNSAMAIYLDAIVKAKSGKYQDADNTLDKIRPIMENVPEAYFLAGEVKFKLNQFGQAEAYLDKFIAHRQDQPQAFELLGLLALRRGDSDRAVTMLERAHDLAPNDSDVAVLLAQSYLAHGEADKALALMDSAAKQQPGNPKVETERALAHFAFGDPGGSVAELSGLFKGGALNAGPSLILAQLRSGKIDDAAKTAQDLLHRDPANVLYQELLGAVRVAQHDYAGAEAIFQAILAKQPTLIAARRSLAQIYLSTNRPDAAIKLFDDWIAKNPNDLKAKQALAGIYMQRKDDASALKVLLDAKVLSAGDVSSGLQVAMIYEHEKKWPEAIAAVRAVQARFANNILVMDALGRIYSESGDVKASVAAYAAATAAFPKSPALWNDYATALSRGKNYPAALDAMNKAHALAPNNVKIERGIILLTYLTKGPQAALAAGQSFSGNTPQVPAGTMLAAMVIADKGNMADAISILEAAQAKAPSTDVAILLAKYLDSTNQMPKAIAVLESWTKAHPADYQPRFALAQLYGASGDQTKALDAFEWLATQRPNDPVVLNNLAWLYSQKKDPRAREIAERAYKAAPQSGAIADTLGWIVVNQGDAADGVKYLEIANKETPKDPSLQYHLAFALAKANQPEKARPILQQLMHSDAGAGIKDSARQLLAKIGN
jgi:putative PEP-CTERM system TPR-repeat lipoprotein